MTQPNCCIKFGIKICLNYKLLFHAVDLSCNHLENLTIVSGNFMLLLLYHCLCNTIEDPTYVSGNFMLLRLYHLLCDTI